MNVFGWRLWFSWRLWKWRNWCDREDFDIHARNLKREDFCFRSFIFFFLSHWKHVLLKGVEVILRKLISKWCSSQNPTPTQSFRVKPLEISYQFSQFLQWQRRRSSRLWGICSNWGVRNSPVRIAYIVRNMIALRNLNLKYPTVDVLCASCSKISTHLTVISLKGIYVLSCRAAP